MKVRRTMILEGLAIVGTVIAIGLLIALGLIIEGISKVVTFFNPNKRDPREMPPTL